MVPIIKPLIICVTGKKKSGKTTFLCALVEELARRGHRTGTAKHDTHGFDMDREGKDTWLHKRAGAAGTAIIGPDKVGMVRDTPREYTLDDLAEQFFPDIDILIGEGFYRSGKPRFEVFRAAVHDTPLPLQGGGRLLAMAADSREFSTLGEEWTASAKRIDLDDVRSAADLIEALLPPGKSMPGKREAQ